MAVENEIEKVPPLHIIGALSLTTKNIKLQVGEYCAGISLLTEYVLLGCLRVLYSLDILHWVIRAD